jgi:hypothetical protein
VAPRLYELRVRGGLPEDWSDWFEGFSISAGGGEETVLLGRVVDPSALDGVIAKVRGLNLELVSIRQVEG